MKSARVLTILALLLLITGTVDAAKIRYVGSDQLRTSQGPDGTIFEFIGNVRFEKDSSDLYSDYAIWYEARQFVRLLGNVRIRQPHQTLAADSLHFDQKTETTRAWGNVILEDAKRHVRVTGDRAIMREAQQSMLVSGTPKLLVDFDQPRVPTIVDADTIQFFTEQEQVLARGNTRIKQGSLNAEADSAQMGSSGEEIYLYGNVHASQQNSELSGNRMKVLSQDKVLQKIEVYGKGETIFRQLAKTSFENDSLIFNESRLTADSIDFYLENDILTMIRAQGNSFTYYTPAPEDTSSRGTNVASGDSTILFFQNSELTDVKVVTSAEGTYTNPVAVDSLGNVVTVDTVVYHADRIHFDIADRVINLENSAQVKQQTITLDAHKIDYKLNTKIVYAYAKPDTIPGKFIPLKLSDRAEVIYGEELVFNLDDRRGKIKGSRTQVEQAYYSSEVLRKEEENAVLVRDGEYTTCELEDPHYHFSSDRMKIVTDDKVFARPVVLYIETVPVFALPYFAFSIKKDRHSGFLPLQFGNFERGSRFVNNVGYYWAASDYWDLRSWLDINDLGVEFNSQVRYAIRYKLAGTVSGSYTRESIFANLSRGLRTRGQLTFAHSHTIDPTVTMSGSGTFVSDASYFTDYSTDLDKRLDRQMRSQFSISKRWEWASATAAVDQTRDLDRNAHSERLPSLRFSLPQRTIFHVPKDTKDKRWYHDLYFSYDNTFLNSSSKAVRSDGSPTRRKSVILDQNLRFNAPLKALGVLTVNPSIGVRDTWYYLPYSDQADTANLSTEKILGRQSWNAAVALSTNLYGTVAPNFWGITGFRHVLTPSATINYQPEILRNAQYASFTGYGSSGARTRNVGFRLANQFQAKYKSGEAEKKLNLFNFDMSASYNLESVGRKWSDVSSSLRIPGIHNLSFQVNMTHSLYDNNTNELRWWKPVLRNISLSTDFSGSFRIPIGMPTQVESGDTTYGASGVDLRTLQYRISQRYSESRFGTSGTISNWIDFSFQVPITKNWSMSYRQNYNIRERESTEKAIELHRDLHCWEGMFTWIPSGSRQGYYFRINVKSLPDIKFEKSESGIRDALFGGISAIPQ